MEKNNEPNEEKNKRIKELKDFQINFAAMFILGLVFLLSSLLFKGIDAGIMILLPAVICILILRQIGNAEKEIKQLLGGVKNDI
jgi:uncharacterized Tic20 family protein